MQTRTTKTKKVTVTRILLLGLAAALWGCGCEDNPTSSSVSSSNKPGTGGATYAQLQKLLASDKDTQDYFGTSVSVAGDTLAVGAYLESSGGKSRNGTVYVFTKGSSGWKHQAKLTASDRENGDWFGFSVSLAGDTLAVGALYEDSGGKTQNGAVYVFNRTGTAWSEQAKLTASDKESGDFFGTSVSLSGDTLAVGADKEDSGGKDNNGAVYVFTRSGSAWSQQAKLTASDKESGDRLGNEVSLSGDTLAVGAHYEDSGGKKDNGAAYVFTKGSSGWSQQAKLLASDKESEDWFGGYSVSLSGDTLAVGAIYEDSGGKTDNGAAYLFKK